MNRYNVGLKQHLKEYLSKSTTTLQDTTAKEDRVSNAMEALDRLRASNPFDIANCRTRGTEGGQNVNPIPALIKVRLIS